MKTSLKATLIASAVAMLPFGSHAAGLGALSVQSGLGQPLRAEIELQAAAQELQSLTARVASSEAFRQANLPYTAVAAGIRLSVESRGNRAVVRLSSDRVMNEPFIDLLVELNWAAGRLIREYTFLLDPVSLAAPAPVAAQVDRPASGRTATRQPSTSTSTPAAADRYQVRRGDTLRGIAQTHRSGGASLDQMLIALFRENPSAFDGENMNRLRAGAILKVPAEAAVQAIEPARARREIIAQAADYEAYRRRLAGAVAARPAAAEPPADRAGAGTIVPRLEDAAKSEDAGDRVKVSGSPSDEASSADAGRLARLQALEEELVVRDKALEEANNRLAALEKSIRELQKLVELRNQSLAQLQQQASGVAVPAAQLEPSARDPAVVGAAPTTAPEQTPPMTPPAPTEPVAATPADSAEPPADPSLLQTLLQDSRLLLGGGGLLALLLGYAGYKVRQRRKDEESGRDSTPYMSELPPETNSVFGATGGRSVDTADSSVIHTDFSQAGLSAIDTDEGVDPVAEADVYMAYGRDAQAEEILLDALKADSTRAAIYLKLLEIYAQRKSLKQFETTATDLYSRTGGEGPDWIRAAEMGRKLDPENPLYTASPGAQRSEPPDTEMGAKPVPGHVAPVATVAASSIAAAAAAATAAEIGTPEESESALSDLDFTASIPLDDLPSFADSSPIESGQSQLKDTWAMPGDINQISQAIDDSSNDSAIDVVRRGEANDQGIDVLPQIDSAALDFDLDAGLDLPSETSAGSSGRENLGQGAELGPASDGSEAGLELELDIGDEGLAPVSPAPSSMTSTTIGNDVDFGLQGEHPEFGTPTKRSGAPAPAFDMDATVVQSDQAGGGLDDAVTDLEKTTFDSSLLDFDFDLEASAPEASVQPPPLDLSSIDLDLEPASEEEGTEQASSASMAEPDPSVLQEVDTKLELARAYEEMGDKEGARELVEEVLREGSPAQRKAANNLLERLA
jgi:pilus assembly protein FimV